MAQIANIVVADGATTPINHTFFPLATRPDAQYREAIASLPLVGQGVTELVNRSGPTATLQRVRVKLALPALEAVTGNNAEGYTAAPKVAYTNSAVIDLILPARGTVQQRKDLRVMLSNLLKDAQVIDLIDNLNTPY
jgi:hypothetical protein